MQKAEMPSPGASIGPLLAETDRRREEKAFRRYIPGSRARTRLPVRQELHCEAPTGVADPKPLIPAR